MKLQRLELFGFKSFADRVAIEFNSGVTAIVGPNGCGKSNISDAIRWVLGEQRPTLVRGARMDEVIFGGSRDRKPISLAEVSLHFANEDGTLPVDYTEVAIARRVFRDGESEYLLNRNICRLKDIQDLFFGTGVGTHAYSLIQQGMVDSILSDHTEERRTIFEEAAGVTRYKTRRNATERKLEATSQDLRRVEDIVGEVEKTVTSLKRQVGKARRFQEYLAEETRLDAHLTTRELSALDERVAPLSEEIRALEEQEAELTARMAERESGLEALEIGWIEARERETAVRGEADTLRQRITRREEVQLVIGETLRNHSRRLEALEAEADGARARADDLDERRANLSVDHRAAAGRVGQIVARMSSDVEAAREGDHHADLKVEQARLANEIEVLRERLAQVRQAAARQSTAEESAGERSETIAGELAERRQEAEKVRSDTVRARAELAAREAGRVEAAEEEGRRRARGRDAVRRLEEIREQLAGAHAAEQAAAGRAEALAALEARFEGYAQGARALLAGDPRADGVVGALPQLIEAREARYEIGLERYLESLGHGLLVHDRDAALRVADRLARSDAGRADLLVPDFLREGPGPEIPDRAAAVIVARGEDAVQWRADSALVERYAPLFSRLLLVADRTAVFRCRAALAERPDAAGYYVIASLDGTLLEPGGRWRTGCGKEEEGFLARRRRLAEAEAESAERRRATEALRETATAVEWQAAEAERAVAEGAELLDEAERDHAAVRERLILAEAADTQMARRVAELEIALAEEIAVCERAGEAGRAIRETETELESDLERVAERQCAVRSALERFEEVLAERISARHAIDLDRAEAEADLRAVDRELEHLAAAEEALEAARAERAMEQARVEEDSTRFQAERATAAEEIENLHAELDDVDTHLRSSAEILSEIEEGRTRYDHGLKALRRHHGETTDRLHHCALTRQELEHRRELLLTHVLETYGADLPSLLERHPLMEQEPVIDLEDMRGRLEEVRRKRANLGPVNMVAVEEYEREAERLDFLSRQRDDLVQARRQLEEAIRKINATARTLFSETFERIRESFDATFRTLFEGGHAEIHLADPEDPLESPIEIVASPRGKRVQSIGLLSGGERALTALALLFAIYRVKPSPFCILDEVDAPLDDANIGRFLAMIRQFSAETQFIIITHNRRTMEAADFLYGVTMEEPGVSTLISVSLEEPREPGDAMEEDLSREAVAVAG